MLLPKFSMSSSKKSRFVKEQMIRLSGQQEIRTPLAKIPLLCDILFKCIKIGNLINTLL